MRAPGDVDHVAPTRQSTADNATRSAWRRFIDRYPALRAVSMYSAAVYSSQGLSLFRSFWLASILGPAGFGIWRFLKLVMAYLARVSGLSAEAMRRELPEAIGAGRHAKADTIVRTLVSTHVLTGIVVSGLCVLAAVVVPRWWPKVPGWIWLAVGLVAPGPDSVRINGDYTSCSRACGAIQSHHLCLCADRSAFGSVGCDLSRASGGSVGTMGFTSSSAWLVDSVRGIPASLPAALDDT